MEGRTRALGQGNGPLDARVLFVAEAPGRLGADRTGVPLSGDQTGRNFGAGMSNGIAYVLDEAGTFHSRVNAELVALESLEEEDEEVLHRLIHMHEERTASPRARQLLVDWEVARTAFRRVAPRNAPALVSATRSALLRRSLMIEPVEVTEERRTA